MRKVALVLLLVFAVSAFVAAQESEYYFTTLYIEKVYPSTLGYRIDYRRLNSLSLATAYLPIEWFEGGPDAMAKIVYTSNDEAVPFLNIFWLNAEISHMVLYVDRNMNALTWGSLRNAQGLEERFALEEPEFQF